MKDNSQCSRVGSSFINNNKKLNNPTMDFDNLSFKMLECMIIFNSLESQCAGFYIVNIYD